ncbi:MAG: hypothetical protein FH748_12525 [Balneolaceae bacterium]|nr:hypothetical protein [Balneolaceae bacterium]
MKNFLDKEYHPVIEDYITDFVEDTIEPVEREAFGEVLVHDDEIRELAFHAKGGKQLLEHFRKQTDIKAREGFIDRLIKRIANEC